MDALVDTCDEIEFPAQAGQLPGPERRKQQDEQQRGRTDAARQGISRI